MALRHHPAVAGGRVGGRDGRAALLAGARSRGEALLHDDGAGRGAPHGGVAQARRGGGRPGRARPVPRPARPSDPRGGDARGEDLPDPSLLRAADHPALPHDRPQLARDRARGPLQPADGRRRHPPPLRCRVRARPAFERRRWPRKNDPDAIRARQDALRELVGDDGSVLWEDLEPWARATEALTGVAVVPVAVVGPLDVELGAYELVEPAGDVVERGRSREPVYVPLANTEGGLAVSLYRGARAAGASGGFRTHVIGDRMTRASAFLFDDVASAVAFGRWIDGELERMRNWLDKTDFPGRSRHAKLREIETHVVGPVCHVLYAFTTGDAVGLNMVTRNSYALNMAYVPERAPLTPQRTLLEGNMGGDKKPSHRYFERGGHGKTVIAETTLTDEAIRRVLKTTPDDLLELAFVGTHGAVASGMQSVAFTPATAIAAIFTATGQDIGMVGTSSMAHGVGRRVEGGLNVSIRLPGLEVATVGGGTTLPYARSWLELMGCAGAGKVYRFAQIVAAATLALEISALAATATAGSENFFRAHHDLGGLR